MTTSAASSYEDIAELSGITGGSGDIIYLPKQPGEIRPNLGTLTYTKHSLLGPIYQTIMDVVRRWPQIAWIIINRNIRNLELDPKDVSYWLLTELLKSRGKSRDNICELLVNLKQPELILESAVKMFLEGAGEDSLLFSISILESNGIESFTAFKKIFESDLKEKEIFVGSFIYISKSNTNLLSECLKIISRVRDSNVQERLIEHLDEVPKELAEQTLEYLGNN